MGEQFSYRYIDPDGDLLRLEEHSDYVVVDSIDTSDNSRVRVVVLDRQRQAAAQALAGDDYRVVPVDEYSGEELDTAHAEIDRLNDERDQMITDLGRILAALDLGEHIRPESPHEVVEREVLPRIRELWTKVYHGEAAQPDRPEPVDPASVRVGDVVEVEAKDGSWLVRSRVVLIDGSDPVKPIRLDFAGLWIGGHGADIRVLQPAEPDPDPAAVTALADALVGVGVTSAGPDALGYARALIRHRGVQVVNRDE